MVGTDFVVEAKVGDTVSKMTHPGITPPGETHLAFGAYGEPNTRAEFSVERIQYEATE